jgi:site-specific recombinase XerC
MMRYLEKAEVRRHYSPHNLRHTFATQLLNAGCQLEVLKELMGHKSLMMTLCYTELYDTTKRRQYDRAMEHIQSKQANLFAREDKPAPPLSQTATAMTQGGRRK